MHLESSTVYFLGSMDCVATVSYTHLDVYKRQVTGDIMTQILQGPIDLTIGLVSGIVWGLMAGCLPHRDDVSASDINLTLTDLIFM